MKNILDYIKKMQDMYDGPRIMDQEPRNMKLARVADIPDAFNPDLEQSEFLKPGETLENWKPNPFLKPHADGGRAGYNDGQLVTPSVDGLRPGYAGKMKWTTKEIQEIYKDLPENVYVSKRTLPSGKTDYNYRAKIRYKGKLYTFPSKVATPENKKQLIKDVEAKWDELAPNRISREEYTKLRLLPENRRLSGDEFAEKLNKKYKKVTYRGEKWNNQNVYNYDLSAPRSKERIAKDLGFFEKRTVEEAKKIINKYSGGKDFLKNKNLTDAQITTRASEYVAMEKQADKGGGRSWPLGRQNKRKVWKNIYDSHRQNGRFKLINEKELAGKDGKVNWKKDLNWRKAKFKDTNSGRIYTYDNLEKMVEKHDGGWNKAIKAYDDNARLNQTTFKGKSLNEWFREGMIKKEYETVVGKKVPFNDKGLQKYMGEKKPYYSFTEAHHFKGVKDYPFETEASFRYANRQQGYIQNSYNKAVASGNPERIKKAKITYVEDMTKLSDDMGGIRYKMDDKRFVGAKGTDESIIRTGAKVSGMSEANQIKLFKKMGYRCAKAGGAGESVACYLDDVKKTRADLKSSDVTVRAKARTKQKKALQVAKTLPTIGKFLRRVGQATVGGVAKALEATGIATPVGIAIEGIAEGGIYDFFRKKGYTHDQAYSETFFPGIITGRPEGVPWYGGAEKLLEKELTEVREKPTVLEDGTIVPGKIIKGAISDPKILQYQQALKDQQQIYDAFANKERGIKTQRKDIKDAASANIQDAFRSGMVSRVNRIMNPESMASRAYQTAVEKQASGQDQRAKDYMAENYVQTEPSKFQEEKLQRERNEAMLQMFPPPTVEDVQDVYKAAGRGDDLKNFTAQDYKDEMKRFDNYQKQSYFADNFRLEKAGGGIAGIRKPHAIPPKRQGLRSIMINVNDD